MQYNLLNNLLLRTPRLSIGEYYSDSLHSATFVESLYLSSYDLFSALQQDRHTDKIADSLNSYLARCTHRCTPFGLNAGISFAEFGIETNIEFCGEEKHAKIDSKILFEIAEKIEASLPATLRVAANNTISKTDKVIRYLNYAIQGHKRLYTVREIRTTSELDSVLDLCKAPTKITEIRKVFKSKGFNRKEIDEYLLKLLADKILISDLCPHHGSDILEQIIIQLKQSHRKQRYMIECLAEIQGRLSRLKTASSMETLSELKKCFHLIQHIIPKVQEGRLFHVDLKKVCTQSTLSQEFKNHLHQALHALINLCADERQENLSTFRSRFIERYDSQAIPLLEALDETRGIGYGPTFMPISSLTKEFSLQSGIPISFELNGRTTLLNRKIRNAALTNVNVIEIEESDLESLAPNSNRLPNSISVIFRIIDFENRKILIEHAGGSNAAKLLGRFGHLDRRIFETLQTIRNCEVAANTHALVAEIKHFPEDRLANVTNHPNLFEYSIPYLTPSDQSSMPLALSDIFVTVIGNDIKLVSKSGQEIIPILCNAHNYSLSELPVYKFLCDLERQRKNTNITFQWHGLELVHEFLPRVVYRNTILSTAQWNLDINTTDFGGTSIEHRTQIFKERFKTPDKFLYVEDDNELFVDLSMKASATMFFNRINGKKKIKLKEFLADENTPIRDTLARQYNHEFIATFLADVKVDEKNRSSLVPKSFSKKRHFLPGSEWLYYKYYCSKTCTEDVLRNFVNPLIQRLEKKEIIQSWFFLRYEDPEPHVRVRYHMNKEKIQSFMNTHNQLLNKYNAERSIWKIQIQNYVRELERYGAKFISLTEAIFSVDSAIVLNQILTSNANDVDRWVFGVRCVHHLLDEFALSTEEKIRLLEEVTKEYCAHITGEKNASVSADKKYREHKQEIMQQLKMSQPNTTLIETLSRYRKTYKDASKNEIIGLVKSYVHMHINRLLVNDQRKEEYLLCSLLSRYYKSTLARNYSI